MTSVVPFDLARMFLGTQPPLYLLEIVVRVILVYVFGALVLRMMGKRGQRTLSPFELLVVIALGSATGDSMLYPEVPILYAWMVIAAIVVCETLMARLQFRFTSVERFLEATPRLVVHEGRIVHEALRAERIRIDELYSMLREHGIENTGELRYAFLELSGQLGLIRYPAHALRDGENTLRTSVLAEQGVVTSPV